MYSINFINPSEKMEFQQYEYLIANYEIANIMLEKTEIPYFTFGFDASALDVQTVFLQRIVFDGNTNNFAFVDYLELDNTKINYTSDFFEGYTLTTEIEKGFYRIAFKDSGSEIVKISTNLLNYYNGMDTYIDNIITSWIKYVNSFEIVDNENILVGNAEYLQAGMPIKYKLDIPQRLNSTYYNVNSLILVDGNVYQCITAGTSASSIPSFDTALYLNTTDGTAEFKRIENYFYGIITEITANNLKIGGVALNYNILELFYAKQSNVTITTYKFTDETFAQVDTNVQLKYDNIPINLQHGKIVYIESWQLLEDTGLTKATIDLKNNSDILLSSTFSVNETFNNTGVTVNPMFYHFTFSNMLRIDVSNAGSNKDTKNALINIYQITI